VTIDVLDLPPEGIDAACTLFASVFGHPVEPEHWRWKYMAGPRLGRINVAAYDDGRCVGHAGASVFPGIFRGRPLPMAQLCDVMADRRVRGDAGPQGVYRRMIDEVRRQLGERFPDALGYGFPGVRAFRLGERLGVYRRLYECAVAAVEPQGPKRVIAGALSATGVDWDLDRVDRLWMRAAPAPAGPVVARTGAYLGWRYRDHPRHAYRLWIFRRWFRDAGWFVTREMPDGVHCVVDALLPRRIQAADACAALWRALRDERAPTPKLETWLPLSGARPTGIVAGYVTGTWRDDLPAPAFQPGDTDVF